MVSQAAQCDMNDAFARLRTHARNHNRRLTDVAEEVVEGSLLVADLDPPPAPTAH